MSNNDIIEVKQEIKEVDNVDVKYNKNFDEFWRMSKALIASKSLPKGYDTVEQVYVAMQTASELKMNPISAINNIAMINGRPSLYGEMPMALVLKSGLLEEREMYLFDVGFTKICLANKNIGQAAYGAFSMIKRKGQASYESTFTLDDAKKAEVFKKNYSAWKTYPDIMLQRRAVSIGLKLIFADVLMGVNIAEYDFNKIPYLKIKKDTSPKKVNNPFLSTKTKEVNNDKK